MYNTELKCRSQEPNTIISAIKALFTTLQTHTMNMCNEENTPNTYMKNELVQILTKVYKNTQTAADYPKRLRFQCKQPEKEITRLIPLSFRSRYSAACRSTWMLHEFTSISDKQCYFESAKSDTDLLIYSGEFGWSSVTSPRHHASSRPLPRSRDRSLLTQKQN